jgi:SAM-dependent methyltransferase
VLQSRTYASHTYDDTNPVKRAVHRARFPNLIRNCGLPADGMLLDFGCGDGRLFRILIDDFGIGPGRLVGYDPAPKMEAEFRALVPEVPFYRSLDDLPRPTGGYAGIFCFEVFEHLGRRETLDAVKALRRLSGGPLFVEVPIEVGPPGLLKNLYRRFVNGVEIPWALALRSLCGLRVERSPRRLPCGEVTFEHPGYAFAQTAEDLRKHFAIARTFNAPFTFLPFLLNNVRVFICRSR